MNEKGVFAALDSPTDTAIAEVGTYYPIEGVFLNAPVAAFVVVDDPGLQYVNRSPRWFEIDWHATVSASKNAVCVHVGIKRNCQVDGRSVMGVRLTLLNQPSVISGTSVMHIRHGDTIQLVVTADQDCVVTFHHYTTTIREFYD